MPVIGARPKDYQTENWLIDDGYYWLKQGRLSPAELHGLTDPVAPLRVDGHSPFNGRNDYVPLATVDIVTSLRLVHVARLELAVFAPGEAFDNSKRRVQGRFSKPAVRTLCGLRTRPTSGDTWPIPMASTNLGRAT